MHTWSWGEAEEGGVTPQETPASTNLWAFPASFIISGGREMKGARLLPVSTTSKGRHCDGSFLKRLFQIQPFHLLSSRFW